MRRLSLALISAVSALAFTQIASAADLPRKAPAYMPPPPPVFSWTGFYLGADVGWGWTNQDASDSDPVSLPGFGNIKADGVIGGVYAGYNWQFTPNFVFGIEGDFTGTDLRDSAFDTNRVAGGAVLPGGITFEHRVNWLASIRGRLGWLVTPTLMLYGTGGGALADVHYNTVDIHAAGPAFPATFDDSGTRAGWVAGGGVEWAWTPNWLLRAEYLHYDVDGASATGIPRVGFPAELSTFTFDRLTIDTARVGIAYKF